MCFGNFHHCKYAMNSSCACQIPVSPVNQVHVKRISWLFSQQSWLPRRETAGSITSLSGLSCLTWRVISHWTLWKISFLKTLRSCSENSRNQLVCHQVMCHKFISKNWWVWVKNSSPSSYAVSLTIIFTISRHESPTPIAGGRVYSKTEL